MPIDTKKPPLLIIAIDAGDHDFIQQFVQEGSLPTIGSIMKRGSFGKIAGQEQLSEWGSWTSLLSGISRVQHGFHYFRQMTPGTYDLKLFTPSDTGVVPLWSHLSGKDKKVAIIDPPESTIVPGLPGIQITDWATRYLPQRELHAAAEPPDILKEARQVFGPQIRITDFDLNSNFHKDRNVYHQILERVEKKGALCRHLLTKDQFDLMFLGFYESHDAAHRFWDYRAEASANKNGETNELSHAIRDVYKAIDKQIGLLLEQIPHDINVFVLSCYGMAQHFPTDGLTEAFCRALGYQAFPEPVEKSIRPLDFVRQIVPQSWREALSHHLPATFQERALASHFHNSTNWEQTTAFSIPSLYTSFLRINLQDREPKGIVKSGVEYKSMLERLEADLNQLIDPKTGEPAVKQIERTVDLFRCEPHPRLPDLFVGWKSSSHFIERVMHRNIEIAQPKPNYFRGSYHSREGFLAGAGPSIRTLGNMGTISLLDLAPTFLSLLEQPVPESMTGQVMKNLPNHDRGS